MTSTVKSILPFTPNLKQNAFTLFHFHTEQTQLNVDVKSYLAEPFSSCTLPWRPNIFFNVFHCSNCNVASSFTKINVIKFVQYRKNPVWWYYLMNFQWMYIISCIKNNWRECFNFIPGIYQKIIDSENYIRQNIINVSIIESKHKYLHPQKETKMKSYYKQKKGLNMVWA